MRELFIDIPDARPGVEPFAGESGDSSLTMEKYYSASQWRLIWWKFRKHKLAVFAALCLVVMYLTAVFCEFLSPYTTTSRFSEFLYGPPTAVHLFRDGKLVRPFIYGMNAERNQETYRLEFTTDRTEIHPVRFFVQGDEYRLWGVFRSRLHLFGVDGDQPVLLFGSDRLGRDLFTRVLYGSRISLTIGLVGVFFTFVFGLILGGISGYLGGIADSLIQRAIDMLISLPQLPVWMALAAALPRDWPPLRIYFGIVVIFSIIGWTGLARVVRGKLLSLREEDFVSASAVAGAGDFRIITTHLIPNFASYIIVSVTLSIPGMILGETALSFIGLGLQPPVVSWGVLLQEAQNIQAIAHQPWMLIPCIFVVATVLLFNFLGDGLRDSADPYK